MSIGTLCPNCGEEYDLRRKCCPVCTINVEMRSAHPPHKTWSEPGYLPFEMFGERFAVTRHPSNLDGPEPWRVSHVATGVAIPNTGAKSHTEARDLARLFLGDVGEKKFKDGLARLRAHLSTV